MTGVTMELKPRHRKLLIKTLSIIVIILIPVGTYVGLKIILDTSRPFVAVAGGSMSPALEIGDLLIVQGVRSNEIEEGDIIVFTPPPEYGSATTIHRVIRIQQLENGTLLFKTKGDANDTEDPYWVPDFRVRGRPIHRIPYIGYILLDPTIPIVIFVIIIIIILAWPERRKKFHPKRRARVSTRLFTQERL